MPDNEVKHQTTLGPSGFERMKCSEQSNFNEVPDKSSFKISRSHTHSQSRLNIKVLLTPYTVQHGYITWIRLYVWD